MQSRWDVSLSKPQYATRHADPIWPKLHDYMGEDEDFNIVEKRLAEISMIWYRFSRVFSNKRDLDSWEIRTSLIRLWIVVDTLYSDYHENSGLALRKVGEIVEVN